MSEDEEHDIDHDQEAHEEVTYETCQWFLACVHATNSKSRKNYYMRCHPLKDMDDGLRVKILVFGERDLDADDDNTKCRIRYVDKTRLRGRFTPKPYKGLTT